jgi:hypothetical protein
MAYRIAGIDVHKKKLAVVMTDVEVDDEYQFERRWYGSNPEQLQRLAEWLIRAAGRGSGDGIHGSIVETALERTRAVLETDLSKSGRCREDVRNTSPSAGVVQSRTARAQERLS